MQKPDLILDLDGTLYDADLAYQEATSALKLANPKSFELARSKAKELVGKGHTSSHHRLLYLKKYLELNDSFTSAKTLKLMTKYEKALHRSILKQAKNLRRDQLLKQLSKKFRISIITNETLRTQLIKLSVFDPSGKYFYSIVTSEEVGVEKPDPKIFLILLDQLKVKPEACWYVGDDWKADIEPAMKLGMKTLWTQEFMKKKPMPMPFPKDNILQQLDQILERIQ